MEISGTFRSHALLRLIQAFIWVVCTLFLFSWRNTLLYYWIYEALGVRCGQSQYKNDTFNTMKIYIYIYRFIDKKLRKTKCVIIDLRDCYVMGV